MCASLSGGTMRERCSVHMTTTEFCLCIIRFIVIVLICRRRRWKKATTNCVHTEAQHSTQNKWVARTNGYNWHSNQTAFRWLFCFIHHTSTQLNDEERVAETSSHTVMTHGNGLTQWCIQFCCLSLLHNDD